MLITNLKAKMANGLTNMLLLSRQTQFHTVNMI